MVEMYIHTYIHIYPGRYAKRLLSSDLTQGINYLPYLPKVLYIRKSKSKSS